ncbi:MAG: TetR/AcrR family transcriptional regulator [Anaerolineae bacterium]|nr:TetR/AcrR family transcriptional regulator [Anaerolineae bacterium]NUQ06751.1 TetR/AcrR family transcriptional regulator [Anaerolineae bacterium]
MARKTKRSWLEEGVRALAELGADRLTIDVLTGRMGVTKGSFYHHFASHDAFVEALLTFWEEEGALSIMQYLDRYPTPAEKLTRLLEITTASHYAEEAAFRAWALQNAQVKAVQMRIDAERLIYLKTLCRALIAAPAPADHMAELLYLTYVGGQQIALEPSAVQALYQEIIRLYLEAN